MEEQIIKKGRISIVSTPIGNKDDITVRAMEILRRCDLVVCEELKIGARLLRTLNLTKELEDLNEQNEIQKTGIVIQKVMEGAQVALISDCGTPLLADPGTYLIAEAMKRHIYVEVAPGASSILTALVRSGLSTKSFVYAGFLSRERSERIAELRKLSHEPRTVILLDTPYRLLPVLEAAAEVMPKRLAYLGMNLTLANETHHYGTFSELFRKFSEMKTKAEYVICFEGNYTDSDTLAESFQREERQGPPRRDFNDRPPRREFSDRPPRKEYGDRPPRKEYGDRPPRKEYGDRPPRKEFGDRPPHREFTPRIEGEDRPPRREFTPRVEGEDRPPRREFTDRPPHKDFGDRPPRKEFGDRPPRKDFGDRPPRREFTDRPPHKDFGDRPPRKEFGDRPPRKEFGDRPPHRDFNDRPPRREGEDRPARKDFGSSGPKKFGKSAFGKPKFGGKGNTKKF